MSLLDTKCQVWHKLSPAAQKRGFACRSMFQKGLPQKSRQRVLREPCIFTPSVMMSDLTTPPPCLRQATVSRGRNRAAPLPTHLLRICAGALKWREQCAISKFAGGKEPTSSRQGGLVCGALRLPHDLIRLPLLFPQNSPCDFCGSPEIIPQGFCCAKSLREP